MLFNSMVFVLFFILIYAAYLLLNKRYRIQNLLLLAASYLFYGYWDWRFLSLLATSTIIDYFVGRRIYGTDNPRKRKVLLGISIAANLSILGFFKYFDFFAENIITIMNAAGMKADAVTLKIILPVGISFYTFQTMSYTLDIYRRKLSPTSNLVSFALFVSFFPQLVAGPIERAVNFLPQITSRRNLSPSQINAGIYLILWGFFKKVVIADNVATISNQIFNGYTSYEGLDIIMGVLAFAVQIYCDFSGYSDIARGISKMMGFELMVNFRLPYFALNPSDFWSRWHISLSSWLRDFLYIPLGGNRKGSLKTCRNLAATMLLGGLWHGARWNFVVWGAFHGVILILFRVMRADKNHIKPWKQKYGWIRIWPRWLFMFVLTMIGWVIFRAENLHQIGHMLGKAGISISEESIHHGYRLFYFASVLVAVEMFQYIKSDLLALTKINIWIRIPVYGFFLVWIFVYGVRDSMEFIYFQF